MQTPLLLLMLGLPGSGKSTVARRLGDTYHIIRLTADTIRIAILPEPRWDMAEHRFFFGILDVLTEQLLRAGQSVLLDANHNQAFVRRQKYHTAEEFGAKVAVLYVTVPEHTLQDRTGERIATGSTDAIPAGKMLILPDKLLQNMRRSFEAPSTTEPVVSISGTASADSQRASLERQLAAQGMQLPPKSARRAKLYMMLGLPGSGKTTIAAEIARQTGAIHLSSDAYRLAMFPEPTFSQLEHDILYRTLDHFTELLLQSGVDVIYDANLNRHQHRTDKYDICQKVGADCRLFWVQTDQALSRSRRITDSHDALRPALESPSVMFDRIASIFEAPDGSSEPFTALDGSHITPAYIAAHLTP